MTRSNVVTFPANQKPGEPQADVPEAIRMVEAILFASAEPVHRNTLVEILPEGVDLDAVIAELSAMYLRTARREPSYGWRRLRLSHGG